MIKKYAVLSQDIRIGECFDAAKVIEELITKGHMSENDRDCQDLYHLSQFDLFEVSEIEYDGKAIVFYSAHLPAIAVPLNFVMEVESVH